MARSRSAAIREAGRNRSLVSAQPPKLRTARILVVGKTGVGKSSIINSVVGAPVAVTGNWETTTKRIDRYDAKYRNSMMVLIDTPGFCDDADRSTDERYLAEIERQAGEIDLILYVTKLDDPRVDRSEQDTLTALTGKFTHGLWDRAVVVLTCADKFTRREYPDALAQRSAALRRKMAEVIGDRAHRIPFVPVTNVRERNPDRSRWMAKLWQDMLGHMSERGFDAFVLSTFSRVTSEDAPEEGDPVPARQSTPAASKPRRRRGAAVAPAPTPAPAPRQATTPVVATPAAVVRPVERRPASTPPTTTHSYVSDGVPVQQTVINVGDGVANIVLNPREAKNTATVIQTRGSSGLLGFLRTAVSWILKPFLG
jgi:predicted GTPase